MIFDYEQVFPLASYAPWKTDKLFNDIYNSIYNYTVVDKYRCYELWELIPQYTKLNGQFLEVGVWKGGTSVIICKRVEMYNKDKIVYLADTFKGVVKASDKDKYYKGGELKSNKESVIELLKSLNIKNFKILAGIFPDETGKFISNDKFSFIHIDVDTYQSTKDIVEWVWDKLVKGGVIVFDDYGFFDCVGVTEYINELRSLDDRIIIHNLNGHAIMVKR